MEKVIKEVTNKTTNKTQLPEFFKLDGKIITDKTDIANQFNTFFTNITNIGPSLASKITTDGYKTYRSFLNEPSAHEFTFNKITEVDVLNIIDTLPSKASSGVDGISPILLKHIKNEICRPVTLILNQCLTNGIFPDKLKLKRHLRDTSCSQALPSEPKRQRMFAREGDPDDLIEPPPQQDSDLQDVLTEHWSSIRSHVARGPVQTRYNFRLRSMDTRALDLGRIFQEQTTAVKVNLSYGFILRHTVSGRYKYYHSSCNCCDENMFNNYRPISILPTLSKVFEKVIFNEVHEHYHVNNLYFSNQYGFRKKHSTELAVLEVIDRITNQLDQGITPINIYLDLSKAFDTLDHDILVNKLQYYGVNGSALALFRSYLTERRQYVDYNETSSSLEHISTGVPQGSIIGPLLFIIYINDIAQSNPYFNFITYADDTTLFRKIAGQIDIENIAKELKHVTEWLKTLNVKKTRAMLFHMPQKKIIVPKIKINGTIIEFVDNFNFVSINLNRHLNWNPHVKIVSNKLVKTVGVLNILKKTIP